MQYASFAGNLEIPRFTHHKKEGYFPNQAALYWQDLDGDYINGADGFRVDSAIFPP